MTGLEFHYWQKKIEEERRRQTRQELRLELPVPEPPCFEDLEPEEEEESPRVIVIDL